MGMIRPTKPAFFSSSVNIRFHFSASRRTGGPAGCRTGSPTVPEPEARQPYRSAVPSHYNLTNKNSNFPRFGQLSTRKTHPRRGYFLREGLFSALFGRFGGIKKISRRGVGRNTSFTGAATGPPSGGRSCPAGRLPSRTPGPAMPQDADADRQIDMAVIRKSALVGIDIPDTGTYKKRSPQDVGLPAHTRIV